MWVRGLKLNEVLNDVLDWSVAPHVGAWIETYIISHYLTSHLVAPHVGAWIETHILARHYFRFKVAPHVGAWIETVISEVDNEVKSSHPMWVRGLKPASLCTTARSMASHPMWVRGLKPLRRSRQWKDNQSHPMWVRGLKHSHVWDCCMPLRRTPCGCVD